MSSFVMRFAVLLVLFWAGSTLVTPGMLRAEAPENWHLETNKDGIKVYSRHLAGSRLKEIKVHCEMPGTLAQLVALYSDVDYYPQVISNTKTARLLRRVSETELFYYLQCDMPTPVADRDLAMRLRFDYNPNTKVLLMHTDDAAGLVPMKRDLVRVPSWTGLWTVRPLPNNRLQIDYTFQVDPGGELPTWLVNMIAPVAPYKSFVKLRESLQLPRYRGRSFNFLNGNSATAAR
jgi:hypothetical protein